MNFRSRMLKSAEAKKSRVVLALDFSDPYAARLARAEKVLGVTKDEIAAVKINSHLLLPYGLQGIGRVIETCRSAELPLIADLKMNDIESTNLDAVESLFDYGFDAVIANPFVGWDDGLGKSVEKIHAKEGGMILLVYMSHRGAVEGYLLRLEGGEPMYRVFAARAKAWGADGVIVSARSPDKIEEVRTIVGTDCLILSPGVGKQGGDPSSSLSAGSDFVIVGRTITESDDPLKVVRSLKLP